MRLQCIVLCAVWVACVALANGNQSKVVCYFGSWSVYRPGDGKFDPTDIDPTLCTHMIYTFVGITAQGEVRILDAWNDLPNDGGKNGFQKFNTLRTKSSGTKTMIAIGGWNEGSTTYSKVMADSTLRGKFVKSVVTFVLEYGFDGFDVDWEYPAQRGGSSADVQNYVLLLKELHASFEPHGLVLSAAVGAAESSASLSYDIPNISKYLDFINLMAYDFHGSWDSTTGHNAPLYPAARESGQTRILNINSTVHYWLKQGAPANKLVLGTGLYGRSFTLTNSAQNVPGSPASGAGTAGPYTREAGMLGYNEICEFEAQGSWTVRWDDDQHVPYAFSGNQWVGYDNVKSITEKANYAKSMGLGGAMVWSVETDDFRGKCGERYPLLKALNRVLRNGASTTTTAAFRPTVTSSVKPVVSTSVKPSVATSANPAVSSASIAPSTSHFSTSTATSSDDESNIICGDSDKQYVRDSHDCGKFWLCKKTSNNDYKAFPFHCPAGLYFDTNYNTCNYENVVQC